MEPKDLDDKDFLMHEIASFSFSFGINNLNWHITHKSRYTDGLDIEVNR